MLSLPVVLPLLALAACTDDGAPADTVAFDLDAPLAGETYWEMPFPSDLRLTADGRPLGYVHRSNLDTTPPTARP